jgi:hypothetical protein
MLWITPEENAPMQGGRAGAHSLNASSGRDSRCTMVLTAWGSGPKNRGVTRPRRQLVAFQKRFRPLGLPLPEIRPEFDRNTSNGGMLQSEMRYLARFQEFHRLSTRRHRVLSRQSGGLRLKNPGPSRASLLQLIFSAVAFVFSS